MFKITILKLKDIIKYSIYIISTMIVITIISKTINKDKESEEKIVQEVKTGIEIISKNSMLQCMDQTIQAMPTLNEEYRNIAKEDDNENLENSILEEVLKTQISSIKGIEALEEKADKQNAITENIETLDTQNENIVSSTIQDETNLKTEIITNNPLKESYNSQYGKVKIKNETSYELTQQLLTPDITIENKNILLFHTHSCESYTSSNSYPYTPTGTFRTTDLNYTVTRVGTQLENELKQYNYNVIHNTDYHDYPAYNGSYTRSLATVENILKNTSSDIIIDIHRDAVGSRSDYAPTIKIGETDIAAQIMFVIGTNGGGLWHPNWSQNLKFAVKIQEKAEELYPGLFKPIMLTNSRYNQHTGKYASIIEVGATGNTLEQCLTSMKYLAKIISETV